MSPSSSETGSSVSEDDAVSDISARVSADPAESRVVLFGYDSADEPVNGRVEDIEERSLKLSIERSDGLDSLDELLLGKGDSSDTDGSVSFSEEQGEFVQ